MKATIQFIIAAFVVSLFASPVFAADSEWSKVYKSCEKEAEKNEVEFSDLRNYIKGCMMESGISAADADSTLDELGPAVENKSEEKDEG